MDDDRLKELSSLRVSLDRALDGKYVRPEELIEVAESIVRSVKGFADGLRKEVTETKSQVSRDLRALADELERTGDRMTDLLERFYEAENRHKSREKRLRQEFLAETSDYTDSRLEEVATSLSNELTGLNNRLAVLEDWVPESNQPEDIRDKLESLEGDERLSAEAIKGLEEYLKARPETTVIAANKPLSGLLDVAVAGITTNQSIKWNGTAWVPFTPGGGGGGAVDSVNGETGVVVLSAADVGADPAGSAAAAQTAANAYTDAEIAALDFQDPITLTTLGSSGAATFDGTTLNIPEYAGGGDGGTVDTVVAGTGIDVDATDPANPVIALDTAAQDSLALADSSVQPADLTTLVPYDGAQAAVNLNTQQLQFADTVGDNASIDLESGILQFTNTAGAGANGFYFKDQANNNTLVLGMGNLTATQQLFAPDATGTIALTDDLTGLATETYVDTAVADYVPLTQKGAASGVATLDGSSKIPTSQLPGLALTDVYTVASQAAQLALAAEEGDIAIRTDQNKTYAQNGGASGTMADWSELLSPTGSVSSVNGQTGAVTLTTADVADTANKRYVTDANLTTIGNQSGTNTGDQTSIVGISSTKAQFNTAVSDGNFLYAGDVTQYTDEMAQDAIGNNLGAGLAYNDTTGSISSTITQYTNSDADARITNAVGITIQAYDVNTTLLGNTTTGTGSIVRANSPVLSGNVGIADVAPSAQLSILSDDGTIKMGTGVFVGKTVNTDTGIELGGTGRRVSGMFTEVNGEILSYAINVPQITTRDTSFMGGIFRLDTRAGQPYFNIIRYPIGSSAFVRDLAIDVNGNLGLNTITPGRKLDVLDATGPQMRLTHTNTTVFTDFQVDASGNLDIQPSGTGVLKADGVDVVTVSGAQTLMAKSISLADNAVTTTVAQLNTAITDGNIIPEAGGTFTGDISVPDEAYGSGWNGSLEVPTKNAVYDKIESMSTPSVNALQALGSSIVAESFGLTPMQINTSTAFADGTLRLMAVHLTTAKTITGFRWYQQTAGNYTADNYNGIGLYTISGGTLTLVASTTDDGNIWKATGGAWTSKALSAPYTAAAGVYFIGMLYNSSVQTTAPAIGSGTTLANSAGISTVPSVDFANSVKLVGSIAGQNTLPATQAMTGVGTSNAPLYVALY
jgi:hypothetical protein